MNKINLIRGESSSTKEEGHPEVEELREKQISQASEELGFVENEKIFDKEESEAVFEIREASHREEDDMISIFSTKEFEGDDGLNHLMELQEEEPVQNLDLVLVDEDAQPIILVNQPEIEEIL